MTPSGEYSRPRLARGVRLKKLGDGSAVLLVPEGVVNLTPTAAAIVDLIDAVRELSEIARALSDRFEGAPETIENDVATLLGRFAERGWIDTDGDARV